MYQDLKSFQQATVIYDFTVEFCNRYVDTTDKTHTTYKSDRMAGQMVQAARSGKQNIAEGAASGKTKPQQEEYLTRIAYASLKELLEDYQDFLRQRGLEQWGKDDPRAVVVRRIPYRSDRTDKSYKLDTTDRPDRTYKTYKTYINNPELAANAMICLINQTTYLLDQQVKALERQMEERGIQKETHDQKLRRVMNEQKKKEEEFDRYLQSIISAKNV